MMTRCFTGVAGVFLAAFTDPAACAHGADIDDFLSAPFAYNLLAASSADRFSWISYERGMRNVWTAAAPDFAAVQLTGYEADDGQQVGGLALSPDGALLAFVRGGSSDRQGWSPNPTSDPDGASRSIRLHSTDGENNRDLGAGTQPLFSPSGEQLVFVRGDQVFHAAAVFDDDAEPAPLFRARGTIGSLRWSPDGRALAFVSNRGGHSFVGVFDSEAREIHWLAPGYDRDVSPVWSPDGTRIAFIRLPGYSNDDPPSSTQGYPFSIWIADAATGEGREIWASPGADGGFAQAVGEPLAWVRDDALVFQSEHEGWLKTYRLPANGGKPESLFAGDCELGNSTVAVTARALFVSTNCGDPQRRHIWRAGGGDRAVPVTSGDGIEVDPTLSASGRYLAYRSADHARPMGISLLSLVSGTTRRLAPRSRPDAYPVADFVKPQPVEFRSADGWSISGQLFLPKDAQPGDERPAIVFAHGGPHRQMLLGFHPMFPYSHKVYTFNQYLAHRGYVVLSVNFRGGTGRGRDFRLAEHHGPRGASEHQDLVAAGRYLRDRPETARDRIGLWGASYGGVMTAMGLARNSDLFAAGVSLFGVYDWSLRARRFGRARGFAGTDEELDLAFRSSAMAAVDRWRSPVLLVHGDDDRGVRFEQSIKLYRALRERGVPVETLVLPDEVHGFLLHASQLRVLHAAVDFFDRRLRP